MEFLALNSALKPYDEAQWPVIRSKTQVGLDRPPSAFTLDSFVSERVTIERGARVIHSVISPEVWIGGGATVRSSVLMRGVRIGCGARICRAVLDDNVEVAPYSVIDCDHAAEYGVVTESGIVVIPANTRIGMAHTIQRTFGARTDEPPSHRMEIGT